MAVELEPKKAKFIDTTREYFDDIRAEMKRVTWPTREQVQATTVIVIVCVFAFAAYFSIVDKLIELTVTKAYTSLVK